MKLEDMEFTIENTEEENLSENILLNNLVDTSSSDSSSNSFLEGGINSLASFDDDKYEVLKPKILVFGVGGGGCNAVNNMSDDNFEGVEFVVANTDAQSLKASKIKNRIQLGPVLTKGLGAGTVPAVGREAAEEVIDEINSWLDGKNMVFITACMGGGTGTGAASVIAKLAREKDILTVGVVTKPFDHEGRHTMRIAEEGIEDLKNYVDTLIIIPNQNLFKIANAETTLKDSFKCVDDILKSGIKSLTDLITLPGIVNLDFADVKNVMKTMGKAMMGTGEATGENRAIRAVQEAITNPLLENVSIEGAKGVIVNIIGSPDITLFEYNEASEMIRKLVDPEANIVIGNAFNSDMEGIIRVSIFATGIKDDNEVSLEEKKKYDYEESFEDYNVGSRKIQIETTISGNKETSFKREDRAERPERVEQMEHMEQAEEIEQIERVEQTKQAEQAGEKEKNSNKELVGSIKPRTRIGGEYLNNSHSHHSKNDDYFKIKEPKKFEDDIKLETNKAEKELEKVGDKKNIFNFFSGKKEKKDENTFLKPNEDMDIDVSIYDVPAYLRNKNNS